MKRIIIKRLSLLNFKGVRDLTIDFDAVSTDILGRNGLGKTTIFDAFTWLLFGKDSQDRKKFDLKTLDGDGRIIPQIPHEVSGILSVNGEDVRLTRRFTEKWVKRAGQADPVFTGNEEERLYDDVPCSAREYDAKISGICNETVFKFITSPACFASQSSEEQKRMLLSMAGGVSDKEIAAGNGDFEELLRLIDGKTLDEFKKVVGAKKSRLKAESSDIPGRIDEKRRDIALMPEEDWAALEKEIAEKRDARAGIERQLDEAAEAQRAADAQRLGLVAELGKARQSRMERINEIKEDATRGYYGKKRNRDAIVNEIRRLRDTISMNERNISTAEREISGCAATRESLLGKYRELHGRRSEIMRLRLTFDESEFVCPTCRRPLDIDGIEARQAEMTDNFERRRDECLRQVADAIKENRRLGKANNERRAGHEALVTKYKEEIGTAESRIAELEASDAYRETPSEPDVTPLIASDPVIAGLDERIEALEAETKAGTTPMDNSVLKAQRETLTSEIEALTRKLDMRESRRRDEARCAELEKQYRSLNEQLAGLERLEFTMAGFSKARSEAIERRINGLFSLVKFRWTATAINGAEKETCEATLDGRPYATCSAGEKILIGLDIINAISTSQGIFAPIFIDNAESLTRELPMKSQIVNLRVSFDDSLVIKNGTGK